MAQYFIIYEIIDFNSIKHFSTGTKYSVISPTLIRYCVIFNRCIGNFSFFIIQIRPCEPAKTSISPRSADRASAPSPTSSPTQKTRSVRKPLSSPKNLSNSPPHSPRTAGTTFKTTKTSSPKRPSRCASVHRRRKGYRAYWSWPERGYFDYQAEDQPQQCFRCTCEGSRPTAGRGTEYKILEICV